MKESAEGQLEETPGARPALPKAVLSPLLSLRDVYAKAVGRIGLSERTAVILSLLTVTALSYWSWAPLTQPGWFAMHDNFPPIWLFEMDKCFQDWQLPCRWGSDLSSGFGSMVFNYQPPLPYYVGELLHKFFGFTFLGAGRTLFILGFLISAYLMFLLAREFWGNLGGILAATFYVYAPYHAVDVYVRGALAESWGIAFFPGVLWAIYKVIKEGKAHHYLLLSLFVALQLLSHNLLLLFFFPVAAVWSYLFLQKMGDYKRLFGLAVSALWGAALAAFFILPARLEQDLARLEAGGDLEHFVSWDQLFLSRFWGIGNSSPQGFDDGMSFQIGWLHWGIAAFAIVLAPLLWRRNRLGLWVLGFFFFSFVAAVFMTHESSHHVVWDRLTDLGSVQFHWWFWRLAILTSAFIAVAVFVLTRKLPLRSFLMFVALVVALAVWDRYADFKFMQFPWRFLALVILSSSFMAGAVLVLTQRLPLLAYLLFGLLFGVFVVDLMGLNDDLYRFFRFDVDWDNTDLVILTSAFIAVAVLGLAQRIPLHSLLLFGALVVGVIGLNDEFFTMSSRSDISDAEWFSGNRWVDQTGRIQYTGQAWTGFDELSTGEIEVLRGDPTVYNIKQGSASLAFITESTKGATLVVPITDFPNWRVRSDGKVVGQTHDNATGLITFDLPPGKHEVSLKLENTELRTAANYISAVAWATWALFLLGWLVWVVGGRWRRLLPRRR